MMNTPPTEREMLLLMIIRCMYEASYQAVKEQTANADYLQHQENLYLLSRGQITNEELQDRPAEPAQ